jgi:hypothetical protein
MLKNRIIGVAVIAAFVLSARSTRGQGGPSSGLFQIVSGSYVECCGFAGELRYPLPNVTQGFIQLTIDPQQNLATMAFLGEDRQTVFSVLSCPSGAPIPFSFNHGLIFSNRVVFHVDPGPPPSQTYWNYTVSNSVDGLRMEGTLGTVQHPCADLPGQFSHSNVVAVLVPPRPVIEGLERVGGLLRFRFTGEPPNDYFVEFAESFPATNWLSLTNFRAKLQTIEAVVTDSLTNRPARFYRLRQQDCQCD